MSRNINVSVIVLDTLRLDTFKKLLQKKNYLESFDGVTFDNCIAPSSWTLPSHASMFTGLYPSKHGAHETKTIKSLDIQRIKLRSETILHRLKNAGYSTYGVSANPYIHPVYGFTGFDFFKEESYFTDVFGSVIEVSERLKPLIAKYRNLYGNDVLKLSRAVIKDDPKLFLDLVLSATVLSPRSAMKKLRAKFIEGWPIEKGGKNIVRTVSGLRMKQPSFLFVNLMEAHDPYVGRKALDFTWATPFLKSGIDNRLIERWKKLYWKASEKAVGYGTDLIRHLVDRFGDDQIIILTSDHGQAFNGHGFVGHGTVLYDEVIRVPLWVMLPKGFERDVKKGSYQSLVGIHDFILAAVSGEKNAISRLTSKRVYAESFSIPANIANIDGIDKRKMQRFDKYQKRVFG